MIIKAANCSSRDPDAVGPCAIGDLHDEVKKISGQFAASLSQQCKVFVVQNYLTILILTSVV